MREENSSGEPKRSLLERLSSLLVRAPDTRPQLLEVLRQAHERTLLDADALSMIEGVLQVADLSARDIMVPRAQMDVIDISRAAGPVHSQGDCCGPFPVSGGRGRTRQCDRHPARQGSAALFDYRKGRCARSVAPGRFYSGIKAAERACCAISASTAITSPVLSTNMAELRG